MADSPRIADLRRRVQQDPASLSFAPLAEELRRAGQLDEAVQICQAGLDHHPEYTSARATLGRALLDLGDVELAFVELTTVLGAAPEHLGALRGVAEIHQRRGEVALALEKYRIALALVGREPELERVVADLEGRLAASTSAPQSAVGEAGPAADTSPGAPDPRHLLVLDRLQRFLDAVVSDRVRRTGGVA